MRSRILRSLAFLLPLALMSAGCILIPEVEERIVQLAVGASTVVTSHATGSTNVYDDTQSVNIETDVDLRDVLEDNGVDVSSVKSVKLAGVSYRVTIPQAGRTITNGTVTIGRGSAVVTPTISLITAFNANDVDFPSPSATTGWISVTSKLDATGVALINTLLDDMLKEVRDGVTATNTVITYNIHGTSNPGGVDTDFVWEIKLELSIIGEVKVDVIN